MTATFDPAVLRKLDAKQAAFLMWQARWAATARPSQIPPASFTECGYMAGRGFGKALALDTPIPTPAGWSAMGDLRDGDTVFDERGQPCRVLQAHDVLIGRDCYRVVFDDGTEITADSEHLWATLSRADRRAKRGPQVRTTAEIAATLRCSNESNHAVPTTLPLDTPVADLPIDPYLLGLWLGDGHSAGGSITTMDREVVSAFERGGYRMRRWAADNSGEARTYGITLGNNRQARSDDTGQFTAGGFPLLLRNLSLINNKHVPPTYLRASREQRLSLVQGLMDSDGHVNRSNGNVEFCSIKRELARGVLELALSLGYKARLYEDRARLDGVDKGPRFRVCWQADASLPPVRLARKVAALRPSRAPASKRRYIKAVEPVVSVPVRCITVDSPSRLYLASRSMIPTHNTRVGAEWLAREAYLDPHGNPCAVIAPTYQDVKFVCFEGESGLLSVIPQELLADYNKGDMVVKLHNCAGGVTEIRGFTAEKPERLRGPQHARIWCFTEGTMVSTPEGDRPIETLQAGDTVLTRKGPRRVLANSVRGPIAVGEVSFSTGAKLVGTPDHMIYTSIGWTRMDQLTKEHELCVIAASSGAASGGTATATATTSGQTSPSARSGRGASTERSGSLKSEPYLMGTTSITSTTTRATTASRTSSASRLAITPASTAYWPTRPSATGRLSSLCRWLVSTAARWCSGSAHYPPLAARLASTAKQSGGDPSHATASTAAPSSSPAPETFAASVASTWRPTGRQYVYCLQVDDAPEYFANGVLVHNCDELAAWQYDETWDMAMFGLRLGADPRILWTTTPKPRALVRALTKPKANRVIVTGSTYDNKHNLPQSFYDNLVQYEGTTLGRQELAGELIDPEESGIIKRSWFQLWPTKKHLPRFDWIIMSLDTAYTEKSLDKKGDPDPTACSVWGVFHMPSKTGTGMNHCILLDSWEEHLGLPDLIKRVKRELNVAYGGEQDQALIRPMFGSDKPQASGRKPDILLIEDKGSGISLRQMLEREGIQAYAYNPGRADKLSRLHIVSPIFAQQRVWLPESERHAGRPRTWCEPMIEQLCSFTGAGSTKHDDHIDACTQAMRLMLDKGLLTLSKPKPLTEDRPPAKRVANPYAA